MDSEMVLIGLGEEFRKTGNGEKDKALIDSLNILPGFLKGKTYFVVDQNPDDLVFLSKLLPFFITAPFGPENRQECGEEQWNTYMRWLSGTLGHKLLMLELGVGFSNPQVIRWPFEKTLQLNLKSRLVRVHSVFPQLTPELKQSKRAYSVKADPADWLLAGLRIES